MHSQQSLTRVVYWLIVVSFLGSHTAFAQRQYPFQNPDSPPEERITNLLSLMTLDEKVACLGNNTGVPRLQISSPGSLEGLHGLAIGNPWFSFSDGKPHPEPATPTQFPQAVGMAHTWHPALIQQAGAAEGYEARYIYQSGKYPQKGLVIWAPNADLARDPRWGRTEESYGEDPYLTGRLAVAMVKGLQGDDPKYWQTASLLKHFMANSNEDTRYGSSSEFDERLMREYYSVPFRMAFTQGGARSFMASYNAWNKTPMTVHPMLRTVLANEWGVNGIVSTDALAMSNMVNFHKYFQTKPQAAAASIKAGINQFLLEDYPKDVTDALRSKLITEADIDGVLRGVFRTYLKLGLLDPTDRVPFARIGDGAEPWQTPAHKALAKQVALESVVLLKNQTKTLPLHKDSLKSIAVIGPYADQVLLDAYGGKPAYAISILLGIKNQLGIGTALTYTPGNEYGMAIKAAKSADVAIVVVGNHPLGGSAQPIVDLIRSTMGMQQHNNLPSEGREAVDRQSISLEQEELIQQVYAANPRTIVVLVSSFPYAITWSQEHVPAIVHITHNAQEQGNAVADVLFGNYNPGGRLVHTWPRSLEQLPPLLDYDIRHGRTYMYFKGKPLYPFGYGLSYTTFRYDKFRMSANQLTTTGQLTAEVDVTNTGDRTGDEVVQLYGQYPSSKVSRPVNQLLGFERINLKPNETKTVQLTLRAKDLAYWDTDKQQYVVETQPITLSVGSSSADLKLSKTVPVK